MEWRSVTWIWLGATCFDLTCFREDLTLPFLPFLAFPSFFRLFRLSFLFSAVHGKQKENKRKTKDIKKKQRESKGKLRSAVGNKGRQNRKKHKENTKKTKKDNNKRGTLRVVIWTLPIKCQWEFLTQKSQVALTFDNVKNVFVAVSRAQGPDWQKWGRGSLSLPKKKSVSFDLRRSHYLFCGPGDCHKNIIDIFEGQGWLTFFWERTSHWNFFLVGEPQSHTYLFSFCFLIAFSLFPDSVSIRVL